MLVYYITASVIISICGLVYFLTQTRPADVGAIGVLAVFVLVYIMLSGLFTALIYATRFFVAKISSPEALRAGKINSSLRKSYYYGSALAFGPIIMIGFSSVGSLGIWQVTIALVSVVLGLIYASRQL